MFMNSMEDFFATPTRPFNNWPDKKLSEQSKAIELALTGNPSFPTVEPPLATYSATVDAFIDQLAKAKTRDMNAVAAKNARRRDLVFSLITLTNSVALTANGNREMLASTLLPLKKAPQPMVLKTPENFRITNGLNPGDLFLKVNGMRKSSLIFEYTEDPPTAESIWTRISSSKCSCTVSGLQQGKRYWFRVAAVGTHGQLAWGETILSPFVQ